MQLPCRCQIVRYDPFDRIGTLVTAEGQEIRFGASACTDFEPSPGACCWLVAATFDGLAHRAAVVNLTGHDEPDRLSQIAAAVRHRGAQAELAAQRRAEQVAASRARPAEQLRRIALECRMTMPPLYSDLVLSGRLDVDSPDHLRLTMVRWRELVDIPDPDIREFSVLNALVPFAKTPYGDWWCWWGEHSSRPAEYDILFCPHDAAEAEVFAPTFPTWLARVCLTWGTLVDNDEDAVPQREHLQGWARVLRQFNNESAANLLVLAAALPVVEPSSPTEERGLGSTADRERLIAELVGPSYLTRTIPWQS
jgi:hypothetical protein